MRISRRGVLLATAILTLISIMRADAAFGDLDPTFGGGDGKIEFLEGSTLTATALVRQKDGKFIAVGMSSDGSGTNNVTLLVRRFNADGSVDTSFGGGGSAVAYNIYGDPNCVALQADGKILVGGVGGIDYGTNTSAYVWRFNTNGWSDTGFGTNGRVQVGNAVDGVGSVAAFKTSSISSTESVLVAYGNTIKRLNSNGTTNTSFGTGGAISGLGSVFLKKDASSSGPANIVTAHFFYNATILRGFTADGAVNPDFGSNGLSISYYGDYWDYAVPVLQSLIRTNQGKIVVLGRYCIAACFSHNSFIASHSADGVLEHTESFNYMGRTVRANPDGTLLAFMNPYQFAKLSSDLSSIIQTSPGGQISYDHFIQPDTKVVSTWFLNIERRLQ